MKLSLQAENAQVTAKARASIEGKGISGEALFEEIDIDGFPYVHVRVDLRGDPKVLTPGKHAVHIHEKADCGHGKEDGFKCAGGHFDPGPAGNCDPDANHPYHAGDLPNITIGSDGVGCLEAITTRVTVSDGPRSILGKTSAPEGTSIMIHGNEDPYEGGESGSGVSGGPRLACGSITAA